MLCISLVDPPHKCLVDIPATDADRNPNKILPMCSEAFADAAPELRSSRDFVLRAVGRHGAALKHAEAFRGDKNFLLDAAKAGGARRRLAAETQGDNGISYPNIWSFMNWHMFG